MGASVAFCVVLRLWMDRSLYQAGQCPDHQLSPGMRQPRTQRQRRIFRL